MLGRKGTQVERPQFPATEFTLVQVSQQQRRHQCRRCRPRVTAQLAGVGMAGLLLVPAAAGWAPERGP